MVCFHISQNFELSADLAVLSSQILLVVHLLVHAPSQAQHQLLTQNLWIASLAEEIQDGTRDLGSILKLLCMSLFLSSLSDYRHRLA